MHRDLSWAYLFEELGVQKLVSLGLWGLGDLGFRGLGLWAGLIFSRSWGSVFLALWGLGDLGV